MLEETKYLGEGEYTQRTNITKQVLNTIPGIQENPLLAISQYLTSMRNYKNKIHKIIPYVSKKLRKKHNKKIFRKRTAEQILTSKYTTGCTDTALASIVLARELNIPTKYVETFEETWLSQQTNTIEGHVFVDIYIKGQWRAYEPKTGFRKNKEYTLAEKKYIAIGKGLDFSELDLEKKQEKIKLESLKDIIEFLK